MTWVDTAVVVLCTGIALLEARRGFLAAALDLAGIVVVTMVATRYSADLTGSLSPGIAFLVLFVLLAAAVVAGVKFANDALKFDIGPFDSALAGLIGVATGVSVSYALCEFLNLNAGGTSAAVAGSVLAPQVHDFRLYHGLIAFLRRLGE
ncbi:MAG: CvpA family protein [Armatimonadota bacterium]